MKNKRNISEKPNQKQGIGLLNTDARLKQLYGTGLEIKVNLEKERLFHSSFLLLWINKVVKNPK